MKYIGYVLLLAFGLVFLLTCSVYEPDTKTGGISIRFVTMEQESLAKEQQAEELLSSLRCVLKRGDQTVLDRVYLKSGESFHVEIKNLAQGENYAVRLYGRNELGCAVGSAREENIRVVPDQLTEVELVWQPNLQRGTVTDVDGNTYETIQIGEQWWMVENLKVKRYRNGDAIPEVADAKEWGATRTGAWCTYNNDPANTDTYGLLYNWHAAGDPNNLAPEGWHVPTDEEWQQLELELGMSPGLTDEWGFRGDDEGDKMKSIGTRETGTGLWSSDNSSATNESCFSVVPSGWRIYNGNYFGIDYGATFWSTTEYGDRRAWSRSVNSKLSQVLRSYGFKERGFSVRCVKD